ncbi:hypothetical protein [Pseudomonas fluorescens]|uniref:hypothetical protein n=1 Tax=Pseudomonas fluorescens TaxID=294 RepID=UPI001071DC50|nr:hypothetical protein [Pseudomonas fluorescens]MDP9784484.1 hypothetical protein [Pseudomonas fluorescens]
MADLLSDISYNRVGRASACGDPVRVRFAPLNQRVTRPAENLVPEAFLQIISLKNVTDEQAMHRLPWFSGIIAPPYDRVRKPS